MDSPRSSGDQTQPDPAESRLLCDGCGGSDLSCGDDGFYYCTDCGAQSQDVVDAAADREDVFGVGGEGGLYNVRHREKHQTLEKKTYDMDEIFRNITGTAKAKVEETLRFEDAPSSRPHDFGSGRGFVEVSPDEIRLRYVKGLQVILQLQCEALVERFGVNPLICGFAGTIWLRYVAASKVFDEGWAAKMILEYAVVRSHDRQQDAKKLAKQSKAKYRSETHNLYGLRSIYVWRHSLRETVPLYSSLAISYLVCYLAREAILPTDISQWALEGKLPYLAVFVDMDKYLGKPSNACPLSSRLLFRPVRGVGAWDLEAAAGSIAQTIGLRLPSVNFYAVACRYLKELSLPMEEIIPHACRVYEWSLPAELWLSSNAHKYRTYVCVMSILIVAIRILYNIHGQGMWEMSLSNSSISSSHKKSQMKSAPEFGKRGADGKECHSASDSIPVKNLSHIQASGIDAKELLHILEGAYDRINITYEYSKDMKSYLNYCKDVVFPGRPASFPEERLIEKLWDIYEKPEEINLKDEAKREIPDSNVKRPRGGEPTSPPSPDSKKPREESHDRLCTNSLATVSDCSSSDAFENMKLDMEKNGFHYLPPKSQHGDGRGYIHYKRLREDGKLIFVAPADYYIMLRACARLAQIDPRVMHLAVVRLERRLDWIERQIGRSLNSSELLLKLNDDENMASELLLKRNDDENMTT